MDFLNKAKTLKDEALQYAVYNFDKLFLEINGDSEDFSAKNTVLPCHMFENIIQKSKEMHWIIPFPHLKACLSATKTLRWVDIDLTYCYDKRALITENDLKMIANSSTNIRSLSIFARDLSSKAVEYFSKMKELRSLEIKSLPCLSSGFKDGGKTKPPRKIKLANLQKLIIDCRAVTFDLLDSLDLEGSTKSLEEFGLDEFDTCVYHKFSLLRSIGSFRNLKYLHLRNIKVHERYVKKIFKMLREQPHLKTLDLSDNQFWPICGNHLKEMFNNLTFIENIDISFSSRIPTSYLWFSGKSLNSLDIHYFRRDEFDVMETDDIDSLLTCLENYDHQIELCEEIITEVSDRISSDALNLDSNYCKRFERTLLDIYYKTILFSGRSLSTWDLVQNLELNENVRMQLTPTLVSGICSLGRQCKRFAHLIEIALGFLEEFLDHIREGRNTFVVKSIFQVILLLNEEDGKKKKDYEDDDDDYDAGADADDYDDDDDDDNDDDVNYNDTADYDEGANYDDTAGGGDAINYDDTANHDEDAINYDDTADYDYDEGANYDDTADYDENYDDAANHDDDAINYDDTADYDYDEGANYDDTADYDENYDDDFNDNDDDQAFSFCTRLLEEGAIYVFEEMLKENKFDEETRRYARDILDKIKSEIKKKNPAK